MALAPLLLLAAAAGQAPTTTAAQPVPPQSTSHRGGRLFISPMGEPFRASGRDDDTLADWFRQADRNHDGRLTLEEIQADADRFFAVLDVNHDGEIDPDEITRYENVVAPEIASAHIDVAGSFFRGGDNDQHQGAGRYGLLDLPEPVVSADSDFNRGVSASEFRAAAAQRFLALDVDHKGYLTLPLLETIRPAPPAAPKASPRPEEPGEALPDEQGPGA